MVSLVFSIFALIICAYIILKINKFVNIFIDFIDDKIKDSDELKEELIKFKKLL